MVLPLLGLLGAAAGTLGAPSINNFLADSRGRAFDESGVDMSSFGEAGVQAQRLASAGLLGPSLFGGLGGKGNQQLVDQMFGVQEGRADRASAEQRARTSAAAGIMNANLNRDKFNNQLEAQANFGNALVRSGMDPMWQGTPLQDHYATQMGVNSPEFMNAGKSDQTIADEAYQETLMRNLENERMRSEITTLPGATAATEAANQAIVNANDPAFIGQQEQKVRDTAYQAAAEPIVARLRKYQSVLNNIPEATKFTPKWIDEPKNAEAKRFAEETLFELRQDWIDREVAQGREPSDTLQKEANKRFPTDLKAFQSSNELKLFIKSKMNEDREALEREEVRRSGGDVLGSYGAGQQGSGNTLGSNKRVIPDG